MQMKNFICLTQGVVSPPVTPLPLRLELPSGAELFYGYKGAAPLTTPPEEDFISTILKEKGEKSPL